MAFAVGLSLEQVAEGLSAAQAVSRWRMEVQERRDGLIVVNDAYNANPDSMQAALRTLAGMGERTGRPTVAVLGEMRELGAGADEEHAAVGRLAHDLGVARLLVVGPGARAMQETDATSVYVEGVPEAIDWVRQNVRSSDVVLVKASRAAGLERVAEALLAGDDEEVGP
jgi:UDP-N-acetylmuramoyl-tripeptide--D-alanyl-D-alanine ligase